MKSDSLGDRMKECYESRSQTHLTCRTNVVIRLDGVAFHTYTKGCNKPFDASLMHDMNETAKFLCEKISGCKIGYVQSDEISLVLTDYDKFATQAWFDNNVQKMASVSASMAASRFNQLRLIRNINNISNSQESFGDRYSALHRAGDELKLAFFDSRVFVVPNLTEVHNYLVWRQQDAMRNAIQMVAQANFSHKELQGKNCDTLLQMIGDKWIDIPEGFKYGRTFRKTKTNELVPKKVWERLDSWNFRENPEWVKQYIKGFVENE